MVRKIIGNSSTGADNDSGNSSKNFFQAAKDSKETQGSFQFTWAD